VNQSEIKDLSWVWCCTAVILALWRQRQEDRWVWGHNLARLPSKTLFQKMERKKKKKRFGGAFYFGGTGAWTQGFILGKKTLYCLTTPPAHFALVILEMGISWVICPSWPQTTILPISVSQVPKITGVSHQHLTRSIQFFKIMSQKFSLDSQKV
jgi:hypothetical protein